MSCVIEHDGPAESCFCWCACDHEVPPWGDGVCFACWHGEHQTDADFYYPDDDED